MDTYHPRRLEYEILWPWDCPTCILVFVEGSSVSCGYKYNCFNYSRAQVDLDLESIQWSQEKERDPDIFEEDDFPPCPPDWSDLDMETYNKRKQEVMGKPIWVQDVDEEDLKELGYLSWKSYVIDSCISNWWPPSSFHIVLMVKSHWTNCPPDHKSPQRKKLAGLITDQHYSSRSKVVKRAVQTCSSCPLLFLTKWDLLWTLYIGHLQLRLGIFCQATSRKREASTLGENHLWDYWTQW